MSGKISFIAEYLGIEDSRVKTCFVRKYISFQIIYRFNENPA
jgi:hypothetical protein